MARELTLGQREAVRRFRMYSANKGLRQRDVIALTEPDLKSRAVEYFMAGRTWPQPAGLNALDRSVGWPAGTLQAIANETDYGGQPRPELGDIPTADLIAELNRRVEILETPGDSADTDQPVTPRSTDIEDERVRRGPATGPPVDQPRRRSGRARNTKARTSRDK